MNYEFALNIAEQIKAQLAPHCDRIEIAGSIRRKKPEGIKDVEIVCIPKPYEVGLFRSGIAEVIEQWRKIKGDLPCKYTQRVYIYSEKDVEGIERKYAGKVDIFFAEPHNWGLILAIRTGSAEYSHKVLATEWVKRGYKSEGGILYNDRGNPVPVREEEDLFRLLGMKYVAPEKREA